MTNEFAKYLNSKLVGKVKFINFYYYYQINSYVNDMVPKYF